MRIPIRGRELLFERRRDGTLRRLDWNLVNTDVGACLEPVSFVRIVDNKVVDDDMLYHTADRISIIDEGIMATTYNTAGVLIPVDQPYV